jgi:hypothetical protein
MNKNVKEVLVKVEYHGQVWYTVQELTMGITHVETRKKSSLRDSCPSLGQTSARGTAEEHSS